MVLTWNKNIESVIQVIEKQCRMYKKMHMEVAIHASSRFSNLSLVAVIISPIPGFLSILGLSLTKSIDYNIFDSISVGFSLITTIIVAVNKFSKYEEISHAHKSASSQYTSLEQNIKRQLMLSRNERVPAKTYLSWLTKKFEVLYESSPLLSCSISQKYERTVELLEKEYELQENKIQEFNEETKEMLEEEKTMYKINITEAKDHFDIYKNMDKEDERFFGTELKKKKKSSEFLRTFDLTKYDDEQMFFDFQG